MFKLTIEANTFAELQENILQAASEIEATKAKPKVETKPTKVEELPVYVGNDDEFNEEPEEEVSTMTNTGVELDTSGIPWDKRIHAASGDKNTKGMWRRRRNVDDDYFDEVVSELQLEYKQTKTVSPVIQKPLQVPTTAHYNKTPEAPDITKVAEVLKAQPAPTPVAKVDVLEQFHTLDSFKNNLLEIVSKQITNGKLTQQWVSEYSNYAFNGKEVIEWSSMPGIVDLYERMIEWNIIKKANV
jgi:hypothetical protein